MQSPAEQHYTSESVWRDPSRFFTEFARDVHQSPDLAWQLFLRNWRARYRQSITGYVWAFVPPLAWTVLFLALRNGGQLTGAAGKAYVGHVIAGMVFWQLFIESAQTPLRTFADARPLLAKLRFPREALIGAALIEVTLQFLLRTPLLLASWFLFPDAAATHWWLLPAIVSGVIAAGCCVGILLLPFSLLYQDVAPALALASGFWLLLTPVGYTVPSNGFVATLAAWNPAAILVDNARAWWLGSEAASNGAFALTASAGLAFAVLAWAASRVAFPHVIARFGS